MVESDERKGVTVFHLRIGGSNFRDGFKNGRYHASYPSHNGE